MKAQKKRDCIKILKYVRHVFEKQQFKFPAKVFQMSRVWLYLQVASLVKYANSPLSSRKNTQFAISWDFVTHFEAEYVKDLWLEY